LNSLYILEFHITIHKKMNRTKSLIILVSITLATFVISIAATTTINVSAVEDEELSYHSELIEYNPEIYDQSYEDYESGYYEDRYGKSYYIE
jgi:hypothetical protein